MTLTSDIIRCSYCDKSIEYRRSRISSSTGYLVCQDCRTTPSVAEAPTDSTHYQEIFAEFKSAKLLDSPHKSDYLHSPSEETLYERNLQEFDLLDNPISQIERTLQSAGLMVPVGLPSRKDVDSLASAPFFQAASSSHHRYASQHQSDPPGSISLDQALAEFDLSEYRNTSDGINLLKPKRSEMKGKSFLCVVCHRHFESFLTLNEHKLIHIPAALPQCNERADQAISIKGQPSIKTKIVASNKTPRSRGVLILRGGRSIRVPKNHPANKFPCHYEWCDITFPTIGQLWDHIDNTIHDISFMKVKYVCKNCNQSYAHRRSLVNHQRLHTGINLYSCEVCNKQFTKHSELIRHISIHAGEKAHKFGIYAKNSPLLGTLKTPKLMLKSVRPIQNYQPLDVKDKLSTVIQVEADFKCRDCNKKFTDKKKLNIHSLVYKGTCSYKCDICAQNFSNKSNLNSHMRIHNGEKPFKCENCDKRFTQNSQLKTHRRVHTGEKPFKCETCGLCFSQSGNLKLHGFIHTKTEQKFNQPTSLDTRSIKCNVCSKMFTKNDFRIHQLIYKGQCAFFCNDCDKRFPRPSELKRHQYIHTSERPYLCKFCAKRFKQTSQLNQHIKRVHQ